MHPDLIILAVIAAFVLLRLRSVLGHKIGHDEPPRDMPKDSERVIQLHPEQREPMPGSPEVTVIEEEPVGKWPEPIREGILEIRAADRFFSMTDFITGAKVAFEMVIEAFARGDRETLKTLLAKEVCAALAEEIDKREKEENTVQTTLISILSAEPEAVAMDKGKARITVRFRTEQMQSERDKEGKAVSETATDIETVEDVWTFERSLKSANPNWAVIET